jgi:hypothetical protein
LHDEFVQLVDLFKSEMKWNTQRILLQRALVLKFGAGIIVENQDASTWVTIAYPIANSSNPVAPVTPNINNSIGQVAGTSVFPTAGFIVKVPLAIVFDQNEMKAFINLYVQQSNYIIQII